MKEYKYKLGFIGAGNMAKAISGGLLNSNLIKSGEMIMSDINTDIKVDNIAVINDIGYVIENCEYVILSVKPQIFPEIAPGLCNAKCRAVISIMAGIDSCSLKEHLPSDVFAIRVMPNTPCAVGKGTVVIAENNADNSINQFVKSIFDTTGTSLFLPEKLFDAVTSVSGSGPAYVYYFIRAMINGGIDGGLDEESSKLLTLSTFEGAVKMIKDSSESIDILIDRVCSKGGTTIQAVNCYNDNNLDGVIREGMHKCLLRSKELSGK